MSEHPTPIPADVWEVLSPRLTATRRERILKAAAERTRHICLVLQDVHDPHNIAACLRSAEAFGLQQVHVVELAASRFKRTSSAARGVSAWLDIHKHPSIDACAASLKQAGFRIAAGMPCQDAIPLERVAIEQPLAVLFGNEHAGISAEWLPHCDTFFTIPMFGFVESLNISVSAAISLQQLTAKARQQLPPEVYHYDRCQQQELLGTWLCRQIPSWQGEYHRRKAREGELES